MTNRFLASIALPAVALLLASCSSAPSCGNSHPYKNYVAGGPIKAPAGVTVPSADAAYQIPAAGTAAASSSVDSCLVTPPSVLTKQDMAKPLSPVPTKAAAAPATPTPAAATKPPAIPVPPPASHPRPVAGTGSME